MLTKIFIILNKKKLRVFFTDFWPNFKLDDNYFYNLLSQKYELEIDPEKPEILFHSVDYSGEEKHKKYNNGITKKIFLPVKIYCQTITRVITLFHLTQI